MIRDLSTYNQSFPKFLAKNQILYFDEGLKLKDGNPTPYFLNFGKCNKGSQIYELSVRIADFLFLNKLTDKFDVLFGPAYKGISIATSVSNILYLKYSADKFCEFNRKEIKKHGEGTKINSFLINNCLFDGARIFFIDDVLTSGKTKNEEYELINKHAEQQKINVSITGLVVVVNREQTLASNLHIKKENLDDNTASEIYSLKLANKKEIPIYNYYKITEIINELYEKKEPLLINNEFKPIDDFVKKKFDEYIKIYRK